mmetsp:Transcript_35993/g.64406  ORF Transcript_35993/g.64406 Transcript_35993/m.64406 type:complete len:222 (-) Transcript_35993:530-1195(-)
MPPCTTAPISVTCRGCASDRDPCARATRASRGQSASSGRRAESQRSWSLATQGTTPSAPAGCPLTGCPSWCPSVAHTRSSRSASLSTATPSRSPCASASACTQWRASTVQSTPQRGPRRPSAAPQSPPGPAGTCTCATGPRPTPAHWSTCGPARATPRVRSSAALEGGPPSSTRPPAAHTSLRPSPPTPTPQTPRQGSSCSGSPGTCPPRQSSWPPVGGWP